MPVSQLRNVNFGTNRANLTGSSGVGYSVLDETGATVTSRTTNGVYQTVLGSGLYAVFVSFPDTFHGQIVWDCPSFTGSNGLVLQQSYASEQYNVEENDPRVAETWQMVNDVTGTVGSLYDMGFGRWKIDKATNRMLFYSVDNSTLIATYSLFDDVGTPTFDGVFERRKV